MRNNKLSKNAKSLRSNQTKEEKHLWYDFLSTLPVHFTRQKIIGRYIVDFCCVSKKLIIELDGSQHFEEKGEEKDKIRDKYLQDLGYKVLRYSNLLIHKQFYGVCEDICKHLGIE